MLQKIALESVYNQEILISLSINEVNVTMKFIFLYNKVAGYWVMSVINTTDGSYYLDSIPLVPGKTYTDTLNILRKFGYMLIGKAYLDPIVSNPTNDYPTDQTLKSEFELLWDDND